MSSQADDVFSPPHVVSLPVSSGAMPCSITAFACPRRALATEASAIDPYALCRARVWQTSP